MGSSSSTFSTCGIPTCRKVVNLISVSLKIMLVWQRVIWQNPVTSAGHAAFRLLWRQTAVYTLVISICWMTIVWEISTMTGSTSSMPDERKSDSSNVPQNWTKNVHFARTIVYAGAAASEIVIIMKRQVGKPEELGFAIATVADERNGYLAAVDILCDGGSVSGKEFKKKA